MKGKRLMIMMGVVVILCLTVVSTLAGGWATITVENLPGEVHAGENVHIEFSVRQHGRELTSHVTPVLRAHNPQTGETLIVDAAALSEKGYFAVDVVFPSEGQWEVSLDPVVLAGKLDLLPLTVLPAAAVSLNIATTPATTLATNIPIIRTVLQVVGLTLLIAAILTALPRRGRVAVPVTTNQ